MWNCFKLVEHQKDAEDLGQGIEDEDPDLEIVIGDQGKIVTLISLTSKIGFSDTGGN